jgi:DNA-binding MarR family transcriptional regulator
VDLAAILGVTRQTLHPLVKALVEQGVIELRFGHIRVLDRARVGADGRPWTQLAVHRDG